MPSNAANIGNQAIQATGSQRSVVPINDDPFNWKKIAADLKAEAARKAAAKSRITNPSVPRALSQVNPAAAPGPSQKELIDAYRAMNNGALPEGMTPEYAAMIDAQAAAPPDQSPKGLLDAYRAMNGGALPEGMTPEAAAMIDQGIDIGAIAAVNPGIAGVISQMQSLITQLPADYAAGKASVNQSYDKLTGDVLSSGKQWMQDLYGRVVDPNDPNAALMQQDPALTEYAQGMSTIGETSDQNRATDLAWFDKMQTNADATYKGLIAALAAQAATPVAAKGGGGGGGGGRRGGRGGGGGGKGVNGWKIPTNTLTNQQSAEDVAQTTDTGFAPGYFEDLMAQTAGDPDLQQLALSVWNKSDQSPRGVTQEVQKAKDAALLSEKDLTLKEALNKAWVASTPEATDAAIATMLRNKGAVLGDDPTTKGKVEQYHIPTVAGQNVPQVITPTPEQDKQNQLAEELLAHKSTFGSKGLLQTFKNLGLRWGKEHGIASPGALLEEETKGRISPKQFDILKQRGELAATEAAKGDTPEIPFNWQGWAQGGGYVPYGEREVATRTENARNNAFYNAILDATLPWNPNAYTVPTKETMTSTGKDSSVYKTANTNKSFGNALPGSPLDLTPQIPNRALVSNPVSNPQGFTITPGATPSDAETIDVSDLGTIPTGGIGFATSLQGRGPAATRPVTIPSYDRPTVRSAAVNRIKTAAQDIFGAPKAPIAVAPRTVVNVSNAGPKAAPTGKTLFGIKLPEELKKKLRGPAKTTPAPKKTVASRIR